MTSPGLDVAEIGALIGDPAGANMLAASMDGRALTAKELAYLAGSASASPAWNISRPSGDRRSPVARFRPIRCDNPKYPKGTQMANLVEFDLRDLQDPKLLHYATTGYQEIEGWGIDDFTIRLFLALDRYQKIRKIQGNTFEIGVFHGRGFILMALLASLNERAVALDVFDLYHDNNVSQHRIGNYGTYREIFEQNLARFDLSKKCDIIVGDSLFVDFSMHSELKNIRLARIDGAHFVDAVVNDLIKTQEIMVPGGIVIVDDYTNSLYTGVNEGCHRFLEFATPRLIIPFAVGYNMLLLTTHTHHADLIQYLRENLKEPAGEVVRVHGFDVVSLWPHG